MRAGPESREAEDNRSKHEKRCELFDSNINEFDSDLYVQIITRYRRHEDHEVADKS